MYLLDAASSIGKGPGSDTGPTSSAVRVQDTAHLSAFWSWLLWAIVLAVAISLIVALWQTVTSRRRTPTGGARV